MQCRAVIYLLGEFGEGEAELFGVTKAADVTGERGEHLSFAVERQDSLETTQLLGAERVAVSASHDLDQFDVRLEAKLAQKDVDVQAASTVEQVNLNTYT